MTYWCDEIARIDNVVWVGASHWGYGTLDPQVLMVRRVEAYINRVWANFTYVAPKAPEVVDIKKAARWFDCFRTQIGVQAACKTLCSPAQAHKVQTKTDKAQAQRHKRKRYLESLR